MHFAAAPDHTGSTRLDFCFLFNRIFLGANTPGLAVSPKASKETLGTAEVGFLPMPFFTYARPVAVPKH